ncbi:LuxR family transcriptional regulator [Amycolatopsis sp. FDAARGOS 1241]|uniref:helix-turn-helix transcriptional regulator n=1 Tax=Amycolatopsis sp. FDAARGOS 1241 TaxID=2778070 RepID=UPI001950FC6E|nr:LuxR family transcriptional regulator [Amycolatopsis sp. FDAARGOS 1241]QRP50427.1 AAA family ATPase [Amycolatopsis sp. FDAARGOS 1241]
MLRDRHRERVEFDRLVDAVRTGRSRVLVVRGEAGVGKTALLEYVAEIARECQVVRAAGDQAEAGLAFAGLHQVCAPLLAGLARLPVPQQVALETVLGLGTSANPPDRFLVGLAVLSLLAEAARERPLVCLVDDTQWLDQASVQALAFVARRLSAESVGMVFALREPDETAELARLPDLVIGGLPADEARALLGSALRGPLDPQVRDRILAETRGNPLALLELPRGLSPAELAGGFGLPGAEGLPSRIEESFHRRLAPLPAETRLLLLIAAAEQSGEAALLWRAAQRLGIGATAAAPAEETGLVSFGPRARFRHPLVRSAVYWAASPEDRRRVHAALAAVTDAERDRDRRAWHRAHAAEGPDEEVAAELARSAGRAQARGGVAAAAAFLEWATRLTRDPVQRAERALGAAQAKHQAGAPDAALELLATAEAGPPDEFRRARCDLLRAQIALVTRRGRDTPALLQQAATRLAPLDARLARDTFLGALEAAAFAGPLASGGGIREVAEAARGAPPAPEPPRPLDLLLDALTRQITEGYAAAVAPLKRAIGAFRNPGLAPEDALRWTWFALVTARNLWDDETFDLLTRRHVRIARDTGTLAQLPLALQTRVCAQVIDGELAEAAPLLEESDAVAAATGIELPPYGGLLLNAWQGRETEFHNLSEPVVAGAAARGEGIALAATAWTSVVLYLGLARFGTALSAAQRLIESDNPGQRFVSQWGAAELIEAAVRTGARDVAAGTWTWFSPLLRAAGTDWALGIEARSRALLTDGPAAEDAYRDAIDHLARTRVRPDLARARLLYGEWLHHQRRRRDARDQLRAAHDLFTTMGMAGFAERAARELHATGETVRTRRTRTRSTLTAQEAQIARLVQDGHTNPEIAARLFLSPRTIESHLTRIYDKLMAPPRPPKPPSPPAPPPPPSPPAT